jgi:UDP-N-acetyl-D-mannosaminuronic acid transferase (WecB/TagA/CpsF family)
MPVKQLSDGNPDGTVLGQSSTDLIGFYGLTTPVVRRAGAAQAAVATTASTSTTPFGYTTQAQADAIVTLVNEMRATILALNLFKGAA